VGPAGRTTPRLSHTIPVLAETPEVWEVWNVGIFSVAGWGGEGCNLGGPARHAEPGLELRQRVTSDAQRQFLIELPQVCLNRRHRPCPLMDQSTLAKSALPDPRQARQPRLADPDPAPATDAHTRADAGALLRGISCEVLGTVAWVRGPVSEIGERGS